ncbi:MAG: hypothetical protein Q4F21_03310 [Lachnospiraceae bacterium]|nr:hypothetical protein [Lachnospiraceae bacterium]
MSREEKKNFEIPYPDRQEMRIQMDRILDAGLPPKQSFFEQLKSLYWGPGLKVIFYKSQLAVVMSILLYLLVLKVCWDFRESVEHSEYLVLMLFPMFYLLFAAMSYWYEEQTEIVELKQSLRYSFTYLISLRMFYAAIFAVFADSVLFLPVMENEYGRKLVMSGFSSMFLFALLSIYLYNRFGKYFHILWLAGGWIVTCCLLTEYGDGVSYLLFEWMPPALHATVSMGIMVYFFIYVGKVGRKDAYTHACQ